MHPRYSLIQTICRRWTTTPPAWTPDDPPRLRRATAILAGDGLQALAFEILADSATDPIAEVRVALCLGLARRRACGMVGGQMLDIDASRRRALTIDESGACRR